MRDLMPIIGICILSALLISSCGEAIDKEFGIYKANRTEVK